MSKISVEEVAHIANLARLELEPGQGEAMARELDRILGYAEQLQALDTDGIEPTAHVLPLVTPVRRDEPASPVDPEAALSNAPARGGAAFAVPKVLDEDG